MPSHAEAASRTRISIRQLRDVIARIIWRFDLPAGFQRTGESMILHAELMSPALALLIQHAADHRPADPGRLRIRHDQPGFAELHGAGQTILLAGPTMRDLSITLARQHGRATVVGSNISAAALGRGLAGIMTSDVRAEVVLEAADRLTVISAATAEADEAASQHARSAVLRDGLAIDSATWQRAVALSLDVLAPVQRLFLDNDGDSAEFDLASKDAH